ncbi:YcjF family protein [Solirhodobacter olei]|uniref:YcjF family protein n=1 Tax=Solirhodobacter olei TaxID=2493082 RepID=UPI000FD713D4|nr:TIGR01620 family protein [Solirhodobacter olei]
MSARKGPLVVEMEEAADPGAAPPVPEVSGAAMQGAVRIAARPRSRLTGWFWAAFSALFSFVLSVAAWNFVTGLLARNLVLGYAALALVAVFVAVLLLIALRELAAFARLRRVDGIRAEAEAAAGLGDLKAARHIVGRLSALYAGRGELAWGRQTLDERQGEVLDADGLIELAERELLGPLDTAARREIEASARQVAGVTALVPLALADVVTALAANLRMIRRIAELYGGRSGVLGSWRLTRAVMTHLVATGAVAVGDDLVHSIAGGHVLSKLSRRFGEGVVNGALTARVGVAALEVCRPLPFRALPKPKVSNILARGLQGLFGDKSGEADT